MHFEHEWLNQLKLSLAIVKIESNVLAKVLKRLQSLDSYSGKLKNSIFSK